MEIILWIASWSCVLGAWFFIWRGGVFAFPRKDKIISAGLLVLAFVLLLILAAFHTQNGACP